MVMDASINLVSRWKSLLDNRYSSLSVSDVESFFANDYQWHGSQGVSYSLDNMLSAETGLYPKTIFQEFCDGFSDIDIVRHSFNEAEMAGSKFHITAKHTGNYFGLRPTGKKVEFLGVALARFNQSGQLVEERELWDEIQLLRQLGVLADSVSENPLVLKNE